MPLQIQGASLFEDREPEWKIPIEEQEALLIKERAGKPNPKVVDKTDPNRRKSIVLDDVATVSLGDAYKDKKPEKTLQDEDNEDRPSKKPPAAFDLEHKGNPPKQGFCFTIYKLLGLESLLPGDEETKSIH